MNPLYGWMVDRDAIQMFGYDLKRPECILAERNGSIWTADARGGVVHIKPDGTQQLIVQEADSHFDGSENLHERFMSGTLPNGLAFDAKGQILISNFGTDRLEIMTREGVTKTLLESIDGKPLGKVNFVLRDSKNRIWITISTSVNPWVNAMRPDIADGYIVLIDRGVPRIVATGFAFTNEIRLDAKEEWMYVVESAGKRISRMRVQDDGSLTDRQLYGPTDLGPGFPDGLAFDAYGNLWIAMIMADRLIALTPEGDVLQLLDDGDPQATMELERHFRSCSLTTEILSRARGRIAPWLASITFGGPDLQTVYLGSLMGEKIPYFRAPGPGLAMVHW